MLGARIHELSQRHIATLVRISEVANLGCVTEVHLLLEMVVVQVQPGEITLPEVPGAAALCVR
jgi:hypothetical protein